MEGEGKGKGRGGQGCGLGEERFFSLEGQDVWGKKGFLGRGIS